MSYWADYFRPQKQPQGPLPPQTIAQQVCDQSRDLAAKFRALHSGWSYLGQLRYFELLTNELPGRLDALCRALTPRYAQKTLSAGAGAWFERLQQAKSNLAIVPVVAALYWELHPDAERLAGLCKKLRESSKAWPTDLEVLMTNAETALRDFVEAAALKSHIGKLEAQLVRERGLASSGAVEDRTAPLESQLRQAKSVLAALEG
jgi:hypothetical protein